MPYQSLGDLPKNVTNNLPEHAQEIYKEAFNSAWAYYKDPDKRRGDAAHEEVAHKVAWAAVEKVYQKNESGDWVKKEV